MTFVVESSFEDEKLEDGSSIMNLQMNRKAENTLYKAAMLENTLTLAELEYQSKGLKTKNFKKLVVAAYVVQCLSNLVEENKE